MKKKNAFKNVAAFIIPPAIAASKDESYRSNPAFGKRPVSEYLYFILNQSLENLF